MIRYAGGWRIVACLAVTFALAACQDGPESTDVESGPIGSSSGGASPDTSPESAIRGAQSFATECAGCHQVDDQSLVKALDAEGLRLTIENAMPLLDPSRCTGACASDTAAYIMLNNPWFGQVTGGPDPGNGSSGGLGDVAPAVGPVDAAPVAIHRLNRAQYNNTVRDLLGTRLTPADRFPEDDFGYGFNNIARVLSVSLTHTEQYFQAADLLVEDALDRALAGGRQHYEAEHLGGVHVVPGEDRALLNRGGSILVLELEADAAGEHELQIRAGQQAGGPDDAIMAVQVDGVEIARRTVAAPEGAMQTYRIPLQLSMGPHTVEIEFINDYWVEGVADRNLAVDWVSLQGQDGATLDLIPCDITTGAACARQFIREFGQRSWRRPLTSPEVERLAALYSEAASDSLRTGLDQVMRAMLLSPHFLYRPELDASVNSTRPRALNAWELASRLSYFLWSSLPDDTLFARAADGTLVNESVLRAEVRRMLDDERAAALVENFAVQWLKFDKVQEANPNLTRYPDFDAALVQSMRQESRLFLHEWIASNAPVSELLAADYSYIDARLAAHYGVSAPAGDTFVKHRWQGSERRGILGHAAILTATSHPSNTSPVLRGAWALEKLLCKAPPPPPPGVENLADDGDQEGLTTRQRFEMHRDSSTVCYSCHVLMDPIGFGLENFNAIGQWRTMENGEPVDASGALPGGTQFRGPLELSAILAESPELPLCVTQHLMTYALGRGVEALASDDGHEPPDYPAVYRIYENTAPNGHRIRDIIEEIVLSPAFRMRRGADTAGAQL